MFEHLVGKRIKLISMQNDPDPMPVGSEGVVEMIGSEFQGSTRIRNFPWWYIILRQNQKIIHRILNCLVISDN